jgi:hypothetical protein
MFVIFLLLPCCPAQDRGGSSQGYALEISDILGRAQLSGSLEYWGICDQVGVPDLPKLRPSTGSEGSPVDQIRTMFAPDSMMQVIQASDGKIRMVEADVPDDFLNVKIHYVILPGDGFGTTSARFAILKTPEVQSFLIDHNIGPTGNWGAHFAFSGPLFNPLHQVELRDVTVGEAFDEVLAMYPGYWFYENCHDKSGARIIDFGFYRNPPQGYYSLIDATKH